jgi:hypothetical protein
MAAARARDIARNVDFLRVLAGEKSTLSADPSREPTNPAFQAFAGSGHKLGGSSGGAGAASGDGGGGGAGKRVMVDGVVKLANGHSDTADERAKRAAAARARFGGGAAAPPAAGEA